MKLDLRTPGTAAEIHRVWMASYRVEGELLGVPDFPPLARTERQIAEAESLFLGVFAAGDLAATAEVELSSPDRVTILALVVHPEFFRCGLATALVRDVLKRFGERKVGVSTSVANEPALELYRALGFAAKRRWSAAGGTIPMVTLERTPEPDTTLSA